MHYRKKIIHSTYIAEGVKELVFSNGDRFYNSTEYIWSQERSIKEQQNKIKIYKSGIDGSNFTPGEFLSRKKRDNIDKSIDSFKKDPIPLDWTHPQVHAYLNEKDKFFKDSMQEYRYDKINPNAGTEIYYFNEDVDAIEFIEKKWELARKLAREKVLNISKLKTKSTKKFSLRFDQPQVKDELSKQLDAYGVVVGELPPGYGKGALFYTLGKDRKKQFNIFVANSIKNTAQLAQAHYFYALSDDRVLSNPIIVCSENRYTRSCVRKTGIKHFPVLSGENDSLRTELIYARDNNIPTNLFVTYQSSQGLYSLLDELEITDSFLGEDEVDTISGKPILSEYCASRRYAHLFGERVGLSGTLTSRPEENTDKSIYYNSDDFVNGSPGVIRTEQYCRENGFIADQRVLVLRFNSDNETFHRLVTSNSETVLTDLNATMRADKMFALVGVKKAIELGRKRIHIPLSTGATTKRLIAAIKQAQKKGLLDSKYKVIKALINDGDEALEDFNATPYSIVIGTRWMNRGVDTVNLDTTIHTIEYSSYQSAIQTKGRGHRLSSEKDYHLNILCQLTGNIENSIMYEIFQKNSTNSGYEIIGPNTVLTQLEVDPDHLDISERTERVREAIERNGIVIEQVDEEPTRITTSLEDLYSAIDEGYLIDENGNDNFRHIVGKLYVNFDSELYELALTYNSFKKFRTEQKNKYLAITWRGDDFVKKCYSHMLDWQLKNNFNEDLVKKFIDKHNLRGKKIVDLVKIPKADPDFSGMGYYTACRKFNIDLVQLGLVETFNFTSSEENITEQHWEKAYKVVEEYKKTKQTWQDLYENDWSVYEFVNKFGNIDKEVKNYLGSREFEGTTKRLKKIKEYSKIAFELKDKNITTWKDICEYVGDMNVVGFMRSNKMLEGILERKVPNILQVEGEPNIKGTPGELKKEFGQTDFLRWARKMEKDPKITIPTGPLKGKRLLIIQEANY